MKKFGRLSKLFLLLMALVVATAGCGGQTVTQNVSSRQPVADDGATEITMWTFYGDNLEDRDMVDVFNEMDDGYNEAHGTNLRLVHSYVPWADYTGTKLVTSFAAGIGPDIFYMSVAYMAKYMSAGNLYKLTDYMTEDILADLADSQEYCNNFIVDGDWYSVPIGMDLIGLFYDKALFAEQNVKVPTTFDELINAATALTSNTRSGLTVRIKPQDSGYTPYTFYPFVYSAGGDIVDLNARKSLLNSDGYYQALKLYQTLAEKGALNISPSRGEDDIGILCEGETAMQVCGSWAIADVERYQEDDPTLDVGVVPIPTLRAGDQSTTVSGGWSVAINAASPVADEAAKLVVWSYLEETKYMQEILTDLNFAYSPRASVRAQNEAFYHNGLRADFSDRILGSARPELRLPTEAMIPLADAIDSVAYGGEAREAQSAAHKELTEFLESYVGKL